jgi:phenylpropionate dioxygenase-like ring-hydroxylating dioxygenase large terminal subunit
VGYLTTMPFLKNVWYVAANGSEIDEGLVSRRICNELLVLYRTSAGEVAALEDRCPHRFVPLSMGKRIGDTLQCGYHGLRFDQAGACVEKPNDADNHNLNPCLKSYPAVERHGAVWVWMGREEQADPAKIPEVKFITDKARYAAPQGYSYMRANYQLIADNLLDLSHVHYLHPQAHQGSAFAAFKNEIRQEGDTIWSMLWRPHYYVDEVRQKLWGFSSDDVEGQGHSRWDAPGVVLVQTAFWEHGKGIEDGVETPSAHFLTPETEFTTHYFWAAGRTFNLDNPEADQLSRVQLKEIFEVQDGPMIESQQAAMGASTDFLEHRPIILKADAAGVMARRLMKRKIREEQEALSAVAAE